MAVIAGRGDGRSLHLQDLLFLHLLDVEVEDEGGVGRPGARGGEARAHVLLLQHGKVDAHLLQQLPA